MVALDFMIIPCEVNRKIIILRLSRAFILNFENPCIEEE